MIIKYMNGTKEIKDRMKENSESNASDFIKFGSDYFSVFALYEDLPVGLIGAKKRNLSKPLNDYEEVFIDIIEVYPQYQRRGIGTELLNRVTGWGKQNNAIQVRAWSEEIRTEALLLWNKNGFTFSQVDFKNGDKDRHGFYVTKRLV